MKLLPFRGYIRSRLGTGQGGGSSAPTAPTGLIVTPTSTGIQLSGWSIPSGSTQVDLFRGTSAGTETLLTANVISPVIDTTVVSGQIYYYVVKAKNAGGYSSASNEVSLTIYLADAFVGPNGTNLNAHAFNVGPAAWTIGSGTWTIQSNAAIDSTPAGLDTAVADAGAAAGTMTATLTTGADLASHFPGMVGRWSDNSNFIGWEFVLATTSVTIFKKVAGSYTQIGIGTFTPATGTPYATKTVFSGNNISVSIGGVLIATATDAFNASATRFGMWLDASDEVVDDFIVYA